MRMETPEVSERHQQLEIAQMRKASFRHEARLQDKKVEDLAVFQALPPRAWIDVIDPTLRKIEERDRPIYATLASNLYRTAIETEEVEYWQGKDIDGVQRASNLSSLAAQLKSDGASMTTTREPFVAFGKAFHMDFEQYLADRNRYSGALENFLDMRALRKMTEEQDAICLDGDADSTTKDGTKAATGLRNSPGVTSTTPSGNLSTGGGTVWVNSMIKMRQEFIKKNISIGNMSTNRITLFCNDEDYNELSKDYSTQYIQTAEQRLMAVGGFAAIVPAENINRNEFIGVINRPEYIRIVEALPLTFLMKTRMDPHERFEMQYRKKMSVVVGRDINNVTGVVRMSS